MTARFIIGDAFDVMADLPDGSVDLILTSPPFLALRSYLPDDHPNKAKEIGSEANPSKFIDTLLRLTAEWDRLLTPHGSIAVELGDSYSGSGNGPDAKLTHGERDGWSRRQPKAGWPLAKSLALIPELYRVALAYGINPLTGEPSPAGVWRVRNVVRWVRPNPPVGALGDKFRPATSEMVVACKAKDRWFDIDAVRSIPHPENHRETIASDGKSDRHTQRKATGAPPLDWWKISPKGYAGSHFATFPPELCEIPIQSMCPREVCVGCGEPRRRVVSVHLEVFGRSDKHKGSKGAGVKKGGAFSNGCRSERTSHGWTICDCDKPTYRPGVVLDPFGGSGTTGAVATGYGRDAVLIDIDERNAELARERIGLFLEVE